MSDMIDKVFAATDEARKRYRREGWPKGMTPKDFAAQIIKDAGLDGSDLATQRVVMHETLHFLHSLDPGTYSSFVSEEQLRYFIGEMENLEGKGIEKIVDCEVNPRVAGPDVEDEPQGGTS